MRRRVYGYLPVVLLVSVLLLAGLWVVTARPVQANGGCTNTYVIRYGDTLYSIARRFGTTVQVLTYLNDLRNPNLIYAGRVLCLPGQPKSGPVPEPAPPLPQIVIEATYAFTPTAEEAAWSLARAGQVGTRVVYPLTGVNAFEMVATATDLFQAATGGTDPTVLWVSPARGASGYTLVSVGAGEPLAVLRLLDTQVVTPFVAAPDLFGCPAKPIQVLADPGLTTVELTLWLESSDGIRYAFPITRIAHADDLGQVEACFQEDALLAVQRRASQQEDGYRVVMVLYEENVGPPGDGWLQRCESWRGGGALYRVLRAWNGCP